MIKPQLNFFKFVGKGNSFSATNSSVYHVFDKYIDPEKQQKQSILFIDCGEKNITGTMNVIRQGWNTSEVHFLITHLHGDHVGGLSNVLCQLLYKYPQIKTVVHLHQDLKDDFESYLRVTGVEEALTNIPSLTNIFFQYHSDNFQIAMSSMYEPIDIRFIRTAHTFKMKSYGILLEATRIYDSFNNIPINTDSDLKIINNKWRVYYSGDSKSIPDEIKRRLIDGLIDEYYQDVTFAELDKSNPHVEFFPHMTESQLIRELFDDINICNKFKFFPYHYSNSIVNNINQNRLTGSHILSLEKHKAEKVLDYLYLDKTTESKLDKIIDTIEKEGKLKKNKTNKTMIYDFFTEYLQYGQVLFDFMDFVFVATNPIYGLHNLNIMNSLKTIYNSLCPNKMDISKIRIVTEYFRIHTDILGYGCDFEKSIDDEFYVAADICTPVNILIYRKRYKVPSSLEDFEFVGYYNSSDRLAILPSMTTEHIAQRTLEQILDISGCFYETIVNGGNELMDINERENSFNVKDYVDKYHLDKYLCSMSNETFNTSLPDNTIHLVEVNDIDTAKTYKITHRHLARLIRGFTSYQGNFNIDEWIDKYIIQDSYLLKENFNYLDNKRERLFVTHFDVDIKVDKPIQNYIDKTVATSIDRIHTYIIHFNFIHETGPEYIQDAEEKSK